MRLASLTLALIVIASPVVTSAASAEAARPFEVSTLNEIRQAHKGRPLIVHFWGLTCSICMSELKDWGAFTRAHPEATIVFINWDQRGARPEQIGPTLQKAGLAAVPSFALGSGFEEKLRFAVSPEWMGELPYTHLITDDGTASAFSGPANFEDMSSWLAKTGPAWK